MYNFFKIVSSDIKLNHKNKITSYCWNSKHKIFFYSNGDAYIYSNDWESTIFHINDEVKKCCIPEGSNFLITICQALGTSKNTLKLFIISKYGRKTANLVCNIEIETTYKVTTLNAFKVYDAELCIAIGLQNGKILLHKSPSSKELSTNAFKCLNVCSKPIKGIEFSQINEYVYIFTCSEDGVFYYKLLSNNFLNETKVFIDDIASTVHCCTLQPISKVYIEQYFVVARDDGLYCYTKDGRGPCYALDGRKKIIEWFRKKYIIVLNIVDRWKMQENEIFQLVIIDIHNKIIVLNKEICNVVGIQTIYGLPHCLIFTKDGNVMALKEKGMRYKMKHLIRKNMFDLALKLLEECNVDPDILADVLVSYGDHMLQRGDMAGAVKIFSKTIGIVSPFTIVNKLSDFRYNESLIEYLNLLTSTDFKCEHLKLLKNCLQRIELPDKAFNIFKQDDSECDKLLKNSLAIGRSEKISSILTTLQYNRNILKYLRMLSSDEVLEFFFEHGYFLIIQYPTEFKETAKFLLTENYSGKQYKVHKIILPLLLLDKSFVQNLIVEVCNQCKTSFLCNIWTELTLQMWQKGNVNVEFVIKFFQLNEQICIDNASTICRNYEFWPGVRLMYEKSGVQILSMRILAKCFEMYPLYLNEFTNECNYHSNQMWIRYLRKDDILLNCSFKLLTEVFKSVVKTNPYYILYIVGGFNTNVCISHLNDFFLDENIFQCFKRHELSKKVNLLEEKVSYTKKILQKYNNQPIEFRSRSCEICKQMTKLPTLYFLCQHSFHKECMKHYSDSLKCLVCSNNRKLILKLKPQIEPQKVQRKSNKVVLQHTLSNKIEKSILNINALHIKPLSSNVNHNIKCDGSTNVDINYDDNLNPFNVKN